MSTDNPAASARTGVLYGLAAYLWWGFVPVYFKAVSHVAAPEVLSHRIVWSIALLGTLLAVRGRTLEAFRALRERRTVLILAGTTVLIALNWFVFIWAVAVGRVLEASLGYFINPLVNVLLGMIFLGERLRRWQVASVGLAVAGVLFLTVGVGVFPWVSLLLAFSFGFYGLLRKTVRADALVGLATETTFLLPLALGYLLWRRSTGDLAFLHEGTRTSLLLAAAGVVTALPLLWFANAVRRLRMATVGFLQYLAPTFQFLLAVLAFGEPFTAGHLVAFSCIWIALGVYTADTLRERQQRRQATRGAPLG